MDREDWLEARHPFWSASDVATLLDRHQIKTIMQPTDVPRDAKPRRESGASVEIVAVTVEVVGKLPFGWSRHAVVCPVSAGRDRVQPERASVRPEYSEQSVAPFPEG
jgi:hypothetical protein